MKFSGGALLIPYAGTAWERAVPILLAQKSPAPSDMRLQPVRMLCTGQNTLSSAANRTTIPRTRISPLFNGYCDSPGVKRLGSEDKHSPASITEFKNAHPLLNELNELPRRILVLFQSFNQTRRKNSWEKTRFAKEKNHLSSGQCTRPQKCFGNGKIKGSALWIVGTFTLFPRFGSLWLLSLPKTQIFLARRHFSSNQEVIAAVEGYFADLTKNHYRDGIMALEHRWNKCISLKGDYDKN